MSIKAIISENPLARFYNEPEIIKTVDITNCVIPIKTLFAIAKEIKKYPTLYDDTSIVMADLIITISQAIKKEW